MFAASALQFDWTTIEKHGVGVAVMVFLLTAFSISLTAVWVAGKRVAVWTGKHFLLPLKERHVTFLDRTELSVQQQTVVGIEIKAALKAIDSSLITQVLQNEKIHAAIKEGACRAVRPTQIVLPGKDV